MRRLSFWSVGLAVGVIVVFNLQGWWVLTRTSRAFEAELGTRLEAVATTLSLALGGRWEAPGAERLLREVREANGLLNVFIVDDDLVFRLNLAGEDGGREAEADLPGLLQALAGIPAQSPVHRSGGLYLKSAYAPLVDSTGASSAALGVEADARFFATLAEFRRGLLISNALSLLAIAAIVLVSLSLVRHALRVEQAAARANALALMGEMSAAMAHEVKNPLAIIRSTAERLKKEYGAGSADPKFDYIEDEADRLAQVVSNYLGIGRAQPRAPEAVDIGRLAREVAAGVAAQAQRTGVAVSAEAAADLPAVRGNPNELRQVLLNLVLNGVQSQPGGGRVTMTATTGERAAGRRGARAARPDEVVVRVKDEGPGVDEKTARRMFDPFFTTREKGSGLGLFVVRRIIEAHGGRVALANPGDRGAELEVRLPVDPGSRRPGGRGDGEVI
jgi:signal transduction histidine kinase